MTRGTHIILTATLAMAALVAVRCSGAASSGSNDAFQVISERNIFDPNRESVTNIVLPSQIVESFRLEGTMTYEGIAHAFFGGASLPAEGRVLAPMSSVADCKIQSIVNGSISILTPDGRLLVVNVGDQ